MPRRTRTTVLTACSCLVVGQSSLAQLQYRLTPVAMDLPGGHLREPAAINNAGTIAVDFRADNSIYLVRPGSPTVLWSPLASPLERYEAMAIDTGERVIAKFNYAAGPVIAHAGSTLDLFGGCDELGAGADINDSGTSVARHLLRYPACTGTSNTFVGCVRTAYGTRTYLPPLVAGGIVQPTSINNANQIAGAVNGRLVVWEPGGGSWSVAHDFADAVPFLSSHLAKINDAGVVAAINDANELIVYDTSTMTLQNHGQAGFTTLEDVRGFNVRGVAIGNDWIWSASTGFIDPMTEITTPLADSFSFMLLRDINDAGTIVGRAVGTLDGEDVWIPFRLDTVFPVYFTSLDLGLNVREHASISDFGFVVGTFDTPDQQKSAFAWDEPGNMDPFGEQFGDADSAAFDVSENGWAVGEYEIKPGLVGAYAFDLMSGEMMELPSSGGGYTSARAINSEGVVVGIARDWKGSARAFLFDGEDMTDLGTLGGDGAEAVAINASGLVAGSSQVQNGSQHAFLIGLDGEMMDLGTLGGDFSAAYAVNSVGQVVGESRVDEESMLTTAFIWEASTGMRTLHVPGGSSSGCARSINDSGQAVGSAVLGTGQQVALFWDAGSSAPVILNTWLPDAQLDGWDLEMALDINNEGEIVGLGWSDGERRIFRMALQ